LNRSDFQEHAQMGGIINFFKNLIGGVFGFIGGLFGGKKTKDGFFMELEEAPTAAPTAVATPEAPAASAKATKQSIKAEKTAAKAEKTAAKAEKAAAKAAVAAAESAPAPAANPLNLPEPTISFAEANRLPTPTPRRRPGANMGSYLNMAKGMNR
jgi:hypothetical protein